VKAAGFLATGDTAVAMIMEWNMGHFFLSTATLLSMLGASSAAWAHEQGGPYYGPHMPGWMFFGSVLMIVFIGAVVAVVAFLVRWHGGPGRGMAPYPPPGRTPLDILKERFAHGEIDEEEFEERRRVLGE
jgi:putative membrane protein